jgi:hypothetical protein
MPTYLQTSTSLDSSSVGEFQLRVGWVTVKLLDV